MKIGKGEGRQRSAKSPSLQPKMDLACCINNNLRNYSHQNISWLIKIDKIRQRSHNLVVEINHNDPLEWLQKYFKMNQSISEISELISYYKYYKNSPILIDFFYLEFMNRYWMKIKTIYYRKIKKELQIQEISKNTTFQKNIQSSQRQSGQMNGTFYVLPEIISLPNTPQQSNNNTLEKIVILLKRKTDSKIKNLKQIDKSYNFYKQKINTHQSIKKQSKTQLRKQNNSKSQSKNNLKVNSSQLISHFSYQNNTQKIKRNAHKSLSNETNSRDKIIKCKKIFNTHSSLNLPANEHQLNYYRLQKSNTKNNEKVQKNKLKNISQVTSNQKKKHKKAHSTQKSIQTHKKSKSNKKKIDNLAQKNVKTLIDKAKNKIKMQKNLMLKKYLQSRQSYTKSIDSTCGEVGRYAKK